MSWNALGVRVDALRYETSSEDEDDSPFARVKKRNSHGSFMRKGNCNCNRCSNKRFTIGRIISHSRSRNYDNSKLSNEFQQPPSEDDDDIISKRKSNTQRSFESLEICDCSRCTNRGFTMLPDRRKQKHIRNITYAYDNSKSTNKFQQQSSEDDDDSISAAIRKGNRHWGSGSLSNCNCSRCTNRGFTILPDGRNISHSSRIIYDNSKPSNELQQQPSEDDDGSIYASLKKKYSQKSSESLGVCNCSRNINMGFTILPDDRNITCDDNKPSNELQQQPSKAITPVSQFNSNTVQPAHAPKESLRNNLITKDETKDKVDIKSADVKINKNIINNGAQMDKKGLSNTLAEKPPEQNNNKHISYRIELGTVAALKPNDNSSKESVVNTNAATPTLNINNEEKVLKVPVPNVNARTYELENFPKNDMIIFNHEHFYYDDPRPGTALDEAALRNTFKQFRFDVTTHNDLKREPLLAELRKFAKQNFDDCGCICVAILTHGSDHGYLKAADMRYTEREVFECFDTLTNPSLVAKPIIFLIQACRGGKLAKSVPLPIIGQEECTVQQIEVDSDIKKENRYFLPTEADLIIFHSCFYGRASGRVVDEGSWFIQTLCEQVNLYASTEHLEKIFRRVRKIIALEKGFEHAKQMPVLSSTLLRKLYLVRNGDLGRDCTLNIKLAAIETERKVDTYLDSGRNNFNDLTDDVSLWVALTIVYCCLLYSSLARQKILYFLFALLFAYLGRLDVSWISVFEILLALFCIFLYITGISAIR